MSVRIMVEWGYEPHTLDISDSTWEKILSGMPLNIKGNGFGYEGDSFIDTWSFAGGIDGEVVVTYQLLDGDIMDEGTGYTGLLSGAQIEHLE